MKQLIKILCSVLLFSGIYLNNTNAFSQIPCCAYCGTLLPNGVHASTCRYYVAASAPASAASSAADLNNAIAGALMGSLLNSLFSKSPTPSPAEIEAKRKADLEAQQRAAELAAELAAENERKAQAEHDKMMKSYNVLDNGVKDLTYKGLIDEKPKWDPSVVVLSEQALLDKNTQTWVEYQREQFKIRLEQPNYWCKKYYEDLVRQDSLVKSNLASKIMSVPPIKVSELQPGDVVLIGDGDMPGQARVDAFLNENDANYSHTVTCIKVVNGKRFYLDNTLGEGPRIITQEQFVGRYGERTSSVAQMRGDAWGVAQPLNETEANKLWDKAMELNNKNRDNVKYKLDNKVDKNLSGTNYGILGEDNMVCSEASWMLINATGRYQIPGLKNNNKLISKLGIEFSPASFENAKQYFLITPVQY
jgi:hypothetical protein